MKTISLMQADENTLMQAIDGKVQIIEPGGNQPELRLTPRERELFEEAKRNHFVVRKGRWNAQVAYRFWCWINEEIYTHILPQTRNKSATITLDLGYGRLQISQDFSPQIAQLLEPHRRPDTTFYFSDSNQIIRIVDISLEDVESLTRKLNIFAKANSHRNPLHL